MKIGYESRKTSDFAGEDPGSDAPPGASSRSLKVAAAVLVASLLVISALVVLENSPYFRRESSGLLSWLTSIFPPPRVDSNLSVYSPLIQNGSANITYPADYQTLAAYALGLVNHDRSGYSLGQVSLSSLGVAQQHADSMLRYGYFSHWDTQGFKPYMRYSLLGGKGAVEENIAYISYRPGQFSSSDTVKAAVAKLESSMMYNDSACCNNGHRDNILNPSHNRVSIGIAYNYTTVLFVEDFETYYADFTFSVSADYTMSMVGIPIRSVIHPIEALVTYDKTPAPETPTQLDKGPREYDPGTLIGGVLPPCVFACPSFSQRITAYATSWKFSQSQTDLTFPLSQFVRQYGAGVYTVYILTGTDVGTAITSASIFVERA